MAPPHTMSLSKRPRTGPAVKPIAFRSFDRARLSKDAYISSSLPSIPHAFKETELISQFRLHRDRELERQPALAEDVDEKEIRKRIFYTREQKLVAVSYATTTWKIQKNGSLKLISKYAAVQNLGITTKMLKDWIRKQLDIEIFSGRTKKGRTHNSCQESELENRSLEFFKGFRKAGRRINKIWFLRHVKQIYGSLYPHRIGKVPGKLTEYSGFKFSGGWFQNFRIRVGISARCPTKKSQQVPEDFRSKIVSWFQFNRRNSQPFLHQIPQHRGGRYQLYNIRNMDQIFLAYEFLDGHCYDFKGSKTIWVKTHRSGWDKRHAILMIYVSAGGVSRCKPLLIFKGNDGPKNSRLKKETHQYDTGVVVQWNQKAYCNADVMIRWLKQQYRYATPGFSTTTTPRLLSLDVFAGQKTAEVKQAFRDLNVTTFFIPSGCTGYVQMLDVAINQPFKTRIGELVDLHYDEHFDRWNKGSCTVGDRRIMLTKWVGQAWGELHAQQAFCIRRTFRKLGLSLAVNGSEDSEISVKNIPNLEVGDWRLTANQDDAQKVEEPVENAAVKKNEVIEGIDNGEREYVMEDEIDEDAKDDEIEADSDSEMA